MAGADPNTDNWGNDVARRCFQIVVIASVLFVGAIVVVNL